MEQSPTLGVMQKPTAHLSTFGLPTQNTSPENQKSLNFPVRKIINVFDKNNARQLISLPKSQRN